MTAPKRHAGRLGRLADPAPVVIEAALLLLARLITAVRGQWLGCRPSRAQRVYFANHASHGDALLLCSVLPAAIRRRVRPVAASDYWSASCLHRFIVDRIFRAVLIDRVRSQDSEDPVEAMARAIDAGDSLIVFPEGRRNTTTRALLPLKSGIYHLARARPDVELVPVWIDNLNRVMPKGTVLPVPVLCTVRFGSVIRFAQGETKDEFLGRARCALLALACSADTGSR